VAQQRTQHEHRALAQLGIPGIGVCEAPPHRAQPLQGLCGTCRRAGNHFARLLTSYGDGEGAIKKGSPAKCMRVYQP
jgi:hypothetical protein